MVIIIHIEIEIAPKILKGFITLNSRNQLIFQSKLRKELDWGCGRFPYSKCDAYVDFDLHAFSVTPICEMIKKYLIFSLKTSNDSGIVYKMKPVRWVKRIQF